MKEEHVADCGMFLSLAYVDCRVTYVLFTYSFVFVPVRCFVHPVVTLYLLNTFIS